MSEKPQGGEKQHKVLIVGTSGATYGIRLLEILSIIPGIETHLIITEAGEMIIRHETSWKANDVRSLASCSFHAKAESAVILWRKESQTA